MANVRSLKVVDGGEFSSKHGGRWVRLRNLWFPKLVLWQRGLVPLLWRERFPAVVFLGDYHFISTWVGAVVARLRGTKVLMWTQGVRSRETGLKRLVRRAFYGLAHAVMLYGHRAKRLLEASGMEPQRLHVIFNSLDYARQAAVREEPSERGARTSGARSLATQTRGS